MKSYFYYSVMGHIGMLVALVVGGTLLSKPRMSYYAVDLMSSLPAGGGVTPGPVVTPTARPVVKVQAPKVVTRSREPAADDLPDEDTIRMLAKLKKKRIAQSHASREEAREAPIETEHESSSGRGGSGIQG